MGTTLVVGAINDGRFIAAHVGDSRAYRFRNGELARLTSDHSLVQQLVEQGILSAAEARRAPNRNIVTRAVGIEIDVECDLTEVDALDGDLFLLCSDGLTDMIDDPTIARFCAANARRRTGARRRCAGQRGACRRRLRQRVGSGAETMTVQTTIETKLADALEPLHLEVINESGNHSVPRGSESHFKVVVVAAEFEGQRLLARHRRVNAVLADELATFDSRARAAYLHGGRVARTFRRSADVAAVSRRVARRR